MSYVKHISEMYDLSMSLSNAGALECIMFTKNNGSGPVKTTVILYFFVTQLTVFVDAMSKGISYYLSFMVCLHLTNLCKTGQGNNRLHIW